MLGVILYLWALIPLEGIELSFIEAMSVGATLSATDPVTVLAIFNTYKVDPSLYTVIFGESILNDAIAIVLFDTAQKYKKSSGGDNFTVLTFFESIGTFLGVFFGSLFFGIIVGVATSLLLKFTLVRRFPKIESCLVFLIAYSSYFFSNAIHMSGEPTSTILLQMKEETDFELLGIVSLLFCGICLKHYAHHNMSRRTQLSTKYIFQILAQLAENFIFIYLGLSLLTQTDLEYKPLFILVTVIGICVARWCVVFPLSRAINWVIRYRAQRQGREAADQLPYSYQAMLFWAGLRGAVGVALAAGLSGPNASFLRATVLVVVVLTVIIFGGTTARMLEILGIRTGVVEEVDSDDEFDIEIVNGGNAPYTRRSARYSQSNMNGLPLNSVNGIDTKDSHYHNENNTATYSTGNGHDRPFSAARRNSARTLRKNSNTAHDGANQGLLFSSGNGSRSGSSSLSSSGLLDDEAAHDEFDLPPPARKSPTRRPSPHPGTPSQSQSASPARFGSNRMNKNTASNIHPSSSSLSPTSTPFRNTSSPLPSGTTAGPATDTASAGHLDHSANNRTSTPSSTSALGGATGTIRQIISGVSEDPATLFKQLDEGFLKPHLLLDPGRASGGTGSGASGNNSNNNDDNNRGSAGEGAV